MSRSPRFAGVEICSGSGNATHTPLGLTESSIPKTNKVKARAATAHRSFSTHWTWLDSNKDYRRLEVNHETNI